MTSSKAKGIGDWTDDEIKERDPSRTTPTLRRLSSTQRLCSLVEENFSDSKRRFHSRHSRLGL